MRPLRSRVRFAVRYSFGITVGFLMASYLLDWCQWAAAWAMEAAPTSSRSDGCGLPACPVCNPLPEPLQALLHQRTDGRCPAEGCEIRYPHIHPINPDEFVTEIDASKFGPQEGNDDD